MYEIPRRNTTEGLTYAELKIREAIDAVEALGADVRLTDAIILLAEASESVADHIDKTEPTVRRTARRSSLEATADSIREFYSRYDRERKKSIEKYGEAGLHPSGRLDYDVYDYLANEIVGLVRYAEMIRERTKETHQANSPEVKLATELSWHIDGFAKTAGPELLTLRNMLLEQFDTLGKTEQR